MVTLTIGITTELISSVTETSGVSTSATFVRFLVCPFVVVFRRLGRNFKNCQISENFTFSNFQQWFDPTGSSADLFDDLYHPHRHLTLLLPDLNKIVDYRAEIKISKYRFLAISGFLELILMEHLEPKKYLRLSATNRN